MYDIYFWNQLLLVYLMNSVIWVISLVVFMGGLYWSSCFYLVQLCSDFSCLLILRHSPTRVLSTETEKTMWYFLGHISVGDFLVPIPFLIMKLHIKKCLLEFAVLENLGRHISLMADSTDWGFKHANITMTTWTMSNKTLKFDGARDYSNTSHSVLSRADANWSDDKIFLERLPTKVSSATTLKL